MEDINQIFKKLYLNINPNPLPATHYSIYSNATSRGKSPKKMDDEKKTDDELEDYLGVCQRCDTCDEIVKFETFKELQNKVCECGHFYCEKCIMNVKKESHKSESCPIRYIKCRIPNWHESENPAIPEMKRTEITRKELMRRPKLWNFEYKGSPVVVSLNREATYGELENRLAQLLSVDLKTHLILIHLPNSYHGTDAKNFIKGEDSLTNGPYEKNTKLKYLRHPRNSALCLEVIEKKAPSSEPPSKESLQSPARNSEKKNEK